MIEDWMCEGQAEALHSASSRSQIDLRQVESDLPAFLAQLDLAAHADPDMGSNLLTIALLDFLNSRIDRRPRLFGLARTKASSDKGTFAALFIRPFGCRDAPAFTALGVPQNAPPAKLFQEQLFPPSLDMDDHAQILRNHARFPEAMALVEQAVLRMLTPAPGTPTQRPRL